MWLWFKQLIFRELFLHPIFYLVDPYTYLQSFGQSLSPQAQYQIPVWMFRRERKYNINPNWIEFLLQRSLPLRPHRQQLLKSCVTHTTACSQFEGKSNFFLHLFKHSPASIKSPTAVTLYSILILLPVLSHWLKRPDWSTNKSLHICTAFFNFYINMHICSH